MNRAAFFGVAVLGLILATSTTAAGAGSCCSGCCSDKDVRTVCGDPSAGSGCSDQGAACVGGGGGGGQFAGCVCIPGGCFWSGPDGCAVSAAEGCAAADNAQTMPDESCLEAEPGCPSP